MARSALALKSRSERARASAGNWLRRDAISQQLIGPHSDLLDVGFVLSSTVSDGLVVELARHALPAHAQVKLAVR